MAATEAEIRSWIARGFAQKVRYVIVASDTFDHSDYPIFAADDKECREGMKCRDEFKRIMEVYDLMLPIEEQIAEKRAMHGPLLVVIQWTGGLHEAVLGIGAPKTEIEVEWNAVKHCFVIPLNGTHITIEEFAEKYPQAVVKKVAMKHHQCFCKAISREFRSDLNEPLKIREKSGFKPAMGPAGAMVWMCLECYEKIQIHFEAVSAITHGMEFFMSSFVANKPRT